MNDFTASNGLRITERQNGNGYKFGSPEDADMGILSGISLEKADALREIFRAEEDERLGRWRDPERDSFVVYPQGSAGIVVLCESTGISQVFPDREYVDGFRSSYLSPSAYAYFDAHPEPTPLPTQPGLYMGALLGDYPTIWSLNGDGSWHLINTGSLFPVEDGHIQKYLPFTPLRPEVTP